MEPNVSLYVPFAKVDTEKRLVSGYASTEALDSQGETVKKDALEAALPDYMKWGNVREMHQPSAVGKTQNAATDDKGTYITVKVVDDNAWKKVREGVYNGFSIGGKVITKEENAITELSLSEISLVDRPANPEAVFDVVKMADAAGDAMTTADEVVTPPSPKIAKQTTPPAEPVTPDIKKDIYTAERLTDLGEDLNYLIQYYKMQGKDTSDMENALKNLKAAATRELAEDETYSEIEVVQIEYADKIVDLAKADVPTAKQAIAAKADEVAKGTDRPDLVMPTEEVIVAELKKQGMEVTEETIALAKDFYAGKILETLEKEQAQGVEADAQKAELAKELTSHLKAITTELGKTVLHPHTHVFIEKKEPPTPPAPLTKSETTPTAPLAPTGAPSELQKLNDAVAALSTENEALKDQVKKLAYSPAAVPVQSSFAVERFAKADDGDAKKTDLLKEIDATSELLKANPSDPALQSKARDLAKSYMELNRPQFVS